MTRPDCAREDELLEALQTSRWPETCAPGLREHVDSCVACRDLLAVAAPLLEEHRALVAGASVPSSAIVWWRAQLRSRREAAEQAAQPISWMFGIGMACAAGLLATLLGIVVPTFRRAVSWTGGLVREWTGFTLPVPVDALASPVATAAFAAIGLCLLLAPIALYYTFRED